MRHNPTFLALVLVSVWLTLVHMRTLTRLLPPHAVITISDANQTLHQCLEDAASVCTFRACAPRRSCDYGTVWTRAVVEDAASDATLGRGLAMYPSRRVAGQMDACKDWFFDAQPRTQAQRAWVGEYMARRVPATGVSGSVVYQAPPSSSTTTDGERYLVIYAAATVSEYQRRVSLFSIRRLRALGAFVIWVEISAHTMPRDVEEADVWLHANLTDHGYDSAAMQEGVLEAFRLFGAALTGFDLLLLMNDSIVGPMRSMPSIADRLEPTAVVVAVSPHSHLCGAGVVLNRAAFAAQGFGEFWRFMRFPCGKWGSMALWEGPMHLSPMLQGVRCLTFVNQIEALHSDDWGALPFYKHRKGTASEEAVLARLAAWVPPTATCLLEACAM